MAESTGHAEFERELAGLRAWIAYPPTPDVAIGVRVRLASAAPQRVLFGWPIRRLAYAAIAIVILAAIAALALAPVRHGIADMLGVSGIRIEFEDDTKPTSTSASGTVFLGEEVTLLEVYQRAAFSVSLPDSDLTGPPDAVYELLLPDGGHMFSFVFESDNQLPNTAETGTGLLLIEFNGNDDQILLVKRIAAGGTLTQISFNGYAAYWIEGASELMIAGEIQGGGSRPSGNVLIWSDNGVTYRMESALSLEEALEIAKSIMS